MTAVPQGAAPLIDERRQEIGAWVNSGLTLFSVEVVDELLAEVDRLRESEQTAGYVVTGMEHGRMQENWDGEVHATIEAGLKSLAECRASGWPDWNLYALHLVKS